MKTIQKVLFTTDFSWSAQQALHHALFIAKQYKAELHLLNVIQTHQHDMIEPMELTGGAEKVYTQLSDNAAERLRELVEYEENGVAIFPKAVCGISIVESILGYITEHDIDIVVMATHGRHGVNRWIMGSISEKIVRLAPCSVITIHDEKTFDSDNPVKKIFVPIDFSEYSKKALRTAIDIAEDYRSELHILHIVEKMNIPSVYGIGKGSIEKRIDDVISNVRRETESIINEYGDDSANIKIHIRRGHAARTIISVADEVNPDLLVIATHGVKGIEYLLIGSVTERVVRYVRCPVLTVKSKSMIKYLEGKRKSA
jgi:nucleotide-binding universal stress UspA family protein